MVARTTFGLKTSAQPRSMTISPTPAASAVRKIVPRLPGSCSPSSIRMTRGSGPACSAHGSGPAPVRACSGIRTTASMPCGPAVSLTDRKRLSGTTKVRTSSGRSLSRSAKLSDIHTSRISSGGISSQSLRPSQTNSPALRRAFDWASSSFTLFTFAFCALVMRSNACSSAHAAPRSPAPRGTA